MKMDVEGWEFSVYEGAQKLIQLYGIQHIVFEYSPGRLRQAMLHVLLSCYWVTDQWGYMDKWILLQSLCNYLVA